MVKLSARWKKAAPGNRAPAFLPALISYGSSLPGAGGDLANWSTGAPGAIPAVGGAMDLVAGVKTIFVITQHTTKKGEPKLVEACTYPLTGKGVVSRVYTELAVVDVTPRGFELLALAPGVTLESVREKTGAPLH